jgi:KDO2-lipid IV(A) lauroyltransferase
VQEGEIIEKFMRQLEKKIVAKPQSWLWSHKRWKHKKIAQ